MIGQDFSPCHRGGVGMSLDIFETIGVFFFFHVSHGLSYYLMGKMTQIYLTNGYA